MTIRHVVAWKLSTEDASLRTQQAARISSELLALRGVVPSILDLSIGPDVVGEGNWDVAIVADFADKAGLQDYIDHPAHQAVVAYVRSVVASRAAVDFEL